MKAQFVFCTIALMTLMGCAKRPPPVDFEKGFLQEKTKYEPNIGKDYWLTSDGFSVQGRHRMSSTANPFTEEPGYDPMGSNGE